MEQPLSQNQSLPTNKVKPIPCAQCKSVTRHKVLAQVDTHYQDPSGMVDWYGDNQIAQCQGCLTITFCETSQFSEDMKYDYDTGKPYLPETNKYYPNRIAGRSVLADAHYLPHGVYSIYEETHASICSQLSIMAGFGIRAIIEATCNDKQVSGGNLAQKIDQLATAGLITLEGSQILHSLRFMGNAAAHEMRAHSAAELGAALDVVEYLLQGVYILPKKSESLPSSDS
jgi:hypothetical protein